MNDTFGAKNLLLDMGMLASDNLLKSNNVESALFNFIEFFCLSRRQIAFLGPLEWRNLFGHKNKVSSHEKLDFRNGVWFLFVLMDAILLINQS